MGSIQTKIPGDMPLKPLLENKLRQNQVVCQVRLRRAYQVADLLRGPR